MNSFLFPFKNTFFFVAIVLVLQCTSSTSNAQVITGAQQLSEILSIVGNKKVGLVAHQSSLTTQGTNTIHLVDGLLNINIELVCVFAPEHGFRGTADAGEKIENGKDNKTGIPVISLYGAKKKPSTDDLKGIEIILFDLQDVGARFYTYISTLHYVMEAAAENNISVVVLDRPNPNGHYVDGPVLELAHQSFVGMHPVPIVHGMTIGEYAKMINGEGWLSGNKSCNLTIVELQNYNHQTPYSLPVKPSPNLPNDTAVNLYPSLCLLEPTTVSIGRGTTKQFQLMGHPDWENQPYRFTPISRSGAKNPKHMNQTCYGQDFSDSPKIQQIELRFLMEAYHLSPDKKTFFGKGFTRIAGNTNLQKQIENGVSEAAIRLSWQPQLEVFKKLRKKYLIYD